MIAARGGSYDFWPRLMADVLAGHPIKPSNLI